MMEPRTISGQDGSVEAKKIGRPPFLEKLSLSKDDFTELYNELGTVEETAEALDISTRSVRNMLKILSMPVIHKRKDKISYSKYTKWVEKNPRAVLPRNVSDICRITKLSRDVIYGYMNYRRRKVLAFAQDLFVQNIANVKYFPLRSGGKIPLSAIKDFTIRVDRYSLLIAVTAHLKMGVQRTFITSLPKLQKMFNKEIRWK